MVLFVFILNLMLAESAKCAGPAPILGRPNVKGTHHPEKPIPAICTFDSLTRTRAEAHRLTNEILASCISKETGEADEICRSKVLNEKKIQDQKIKELIEGCN